LCEFEPWQTKQGEGTPSIFILDIKRSLKPPCLRKKRVKLLPSHAGQQKGKERRGTPSHRPYREGKRASSSFCGRNEKRTSGQRFTFASKELIK